MKKHTVVTMLFFGYLLIHLINGCKKNSTGNPPPTDVGTRVSFTEEFENINQLPAKGWVNIDNSYNEGGGPSAAWIQGFNAPAKTGGWLGFTAYSYTSAATEYAYSSVSGVNSLNTISSWLITPVLSVKNGDKISFYSRGDTTANIFVNRLQVRTNNSSSSYVGKTKSSVGGFTNILIDINATQTPGGYPRVWTKYEYTFSGISGNMDTRVGFRHYMTDAPDTRGIGIDLFKFEVN